MISLYHHQIGSFAMLFVIVFLNFVCIVTIFLFLIRVFLDIELLIVHLIFGVSVEYWDYVHFCRGVEFLVSALAYEILGFPVIMLFFWFERVESDFGVCFMWLDFLVLFLLKLTFLLLLCFFLIYLSINFWKLASFQWIFQFCFSFCITCLVFVIVLLQDSIAIFHHIKRKSFSLDNQWSKHSLSKLSIVGSSSSFKPFNIKWSLINPEKKYFLGLISSLFLSNDLALWLFVSCLYFHKTLALNVLSFLSFIDIDIHIS